MKRLTLPQKTEEKTMFIEYDMTKFEDDPDSKAAIEAISKMFDETPAHESWEDFQKWLDTQTRQNGGSASKKQDIKSSSKESTAAKK